jgi:pyruvate dehydrogenase E1 component alpha subunit
VVDGNDLWAVHAAARGAVDRAREGGGPTLLECRTYRHHGHSKSDPATYRPKDEVDHWLGRDPLKLARARLAQEGMGEQQIAAAEKATAELMEEAIATARAAPYPEPAVDAATEYRS